MWMIYPLIFLAGFVDSIAGGGGLIAVPAYVAVGIPAHIALGTNKFASVCGTAISTVRFARSGNIQWLSALVAMGAALVGSTLGASLALYLDERIITYFMVAAIPCLVVFLLVKKDFGIKEKELPKKKIIAYSIPVGFFLGAYDGFFGPGAGTFMIMAFTIVLGVGLLTACGNTKIVNLGSALAAAVTFILNGSVDYKIGIPCAACSILGSYVGSGLALKSGAKIVRPIMIVVIAILLGKILFDYILP